MGVEWRRRRRRGAVRASNGEAGLKTSIPGGLPHPAAQVLAWAAGSAVAAPRHDERATCVSVSWSDLWNAGFAEVGTGQWSDLKVRAHTARQSGGTPVLTTAQRRRLMGNTLLPCLPLRFSEENKDVTEEPGWLGEGCEA
ncbi:hypothetical protein E2C01_018359 [Portunus trituberculatus]|uniref:Uncharacterized protein n=1 Tax=Portunus trituberculatus TaxID=210409 RepID=A0A5B7DWM2_PORTR|nr:hypothetical protein [Portunus trituberculatus]